MSKKCKNLKGNIVIYTNGLKQRNQCHFYASEIFYNKTEKKINPKF